MKHVCPEAITIDGKYVIRLPIRNWNLAGDVEGSISQAVLLDYL